ncbi:hypothetical protein DRW07_14005 [Alteromonas sediminis]|uniref:OmpR/PhoB-type domain-containing protein n=1 Tax=Alteromonas sediminis TaxID=2259342 RepID=A0A3N5XXV8_9ALTE|nr:winged helix-turn-helix domain-containing protein [Alteromonas sediminis]RPJ65917.1 hypothetical protein DRW07_14005 [Alteromonas sediminis]
MQPEHAYKLGDFRVEPSECALYHEHIGKQTLQPKFIDVLNYLASQYPRVVSRQELIDSVWLGNEHVGKKALTNAIWHLRKALNASDKETIETIRKTGYRLLIEPQQIETESTELNPSSRDRWFALPATKYAASVVMVLILLITTLALREPPHDHHVPVTVTTEPGLELFPAPSPDGRFVVYKWISPDGQVDLFKRDMQQPERPAIRITHDQALEGHSVWSADGKFLYFSRKDRKIGQCDVVRMDMQNYQESFVTACPIVGGYHYIDIAADNSMLAFYGDDEEASRSGIYTLDLTDPDARPQRLSCDKDCEYKERDMAFSPNGQYLALTRRYNQFNENIYLLDLQNNNERQLTYHEQDIVGLSWHPSGKKLVYGVQSADNRRGFVLNIENGDIEALGIEGLSYPNFARNTPALFFQHRREQYQIAALPIDNSVSSSPFPVLQSGYNHKYPDFSSVSRRIAYVSNETGAYEIWTADSQGNDRRQLTFLQRSASYPRWSHDGRFIAFLAPDEENKGDHIFIVEASTRRVQKIDSPFSRHNRPFWSPDDNNIMSTAYTSTHADIYEFSVGANTEPKRITFNKGRYGIVLNEGNLVYSTWGNGLWSLNLVTGQSSQLLNSDTFREAYAWAATPTGVYYLVEEKQHQELHFLDFTSNAITLMLKAPLSTIVKDGALRIDPAQQRILFTKTLFNQSDIKYIQMKP